MLESGFYVAKKMNECHTIEDIQFSKKLIISV